MTLLSCDCSVHICVESPPDSSTAVFMLLLPTVQAPSACTQLVAECHGREAIARWLSSLLAGDPQAHGDIPTAVSLPVTSFTQL